MMSTSGDPNPGSAGALHLLELISNPDRYKEALGDLVAKTATAEQMMKDAVAQKAEADKLLTDARAAAKMVADQAAELAEASIAKNRDLADREADLAKREQAMKVESARLADGHNARAGELEVENDRLRAWAEELNRWANELDEKAKAAVADQTALEAARAQARAAHTQLEKRIEIMRNAVRDLSFGPA